MSNGVLSTSGYIATCPKCDGGVRYLGIEHPDRVIASWLRAVISAGLRVKHNSDGTPRSVTSDDMLDKGHCRCGKNAISDAKLGISPTCRDIIFG